MRQEGLGAAGDDFLPATGRERVGWCGTGALQHMALHVPVTSPSPNLHPAECPVEMGESGGHGTTLGMTGGREEQNKELCLWKVKQGNMEQQKGLMMLLIN